MFICDSMYLNQSKTYLIVKIQWRKKIMSVRVTSLRLSFRSQTWAVIIVFVYCVRFFYFTSKFVHKCSTYVRKKERKKEQNSRMKKKNSICDSYRLYTMRSCIIAYAATVSNQYTYSLTHSLPIQIIYIRNGEWQRQQTFKTALNRLHILYIISDAFAILFAGIRFEETNTIFFYRTIISVPSWIQFADLWRRIYSFDANIFFWIYSVGIFFHLCSTSELPKWCIAIKFISKFWKRNLERGK